MASPVEFVGCNTMLGAPRGEEHRVSGLPCFRNGQVVVSCWQFSPEELAAIAADGGRVYLSVWGGTTQPPVFIGDKATVREVAADYGPLWSET
jgi:hypothetical protein